MGNLRPMYMSDLVRVTAIIDSHDEDDAEAARDDFQENGVDGYFVYEVEGEVIGVTGFLNVPATENTAWLSWTYVHESECGKGYGRAMLEALVDKLNAEHVRKVFVKVSNYKDPEDGEIYARALQLYKKLGFEHELTNKDFYDDGEDQLILGLNLILAESEIEVLEEKPVIRFNGLFEIAETEGAYTFSWIVKEKKTLFGKRSFSVDDLRLGLQAVKEKGGRKVFITFPSNLPLIHQPLQSAGFKYVGSLKDYYEPGVNEMHFCHDLTL